MNKPFDPSKPVQTRDGRKARIICSDRAGLYPIVALIESPEASHQETAFYYTKRGLWPRSYEDTPSPYDLVNVPERKVRYVGAKYDPGELGDPDRILFSASLRGSLDIIKAARWPYALELTLEDDVLVGVSLVDNLAKGEE